jgi:hypothetical protein
MSRRTLHIILLFALGLLIVAPAGAQEGDIAIDDQALVMSTNLYGLDAWALEGRLTNTGADAQSRITLTAEIPDAAGTIIAEGVGGLVTACGAPLFDHVLQPGESRSFLIPLDVYEGDLASQDGDAVAVSIAAEAAPERTLTPDEGCIAYTGVACDQADGMNHLLAVLRGEVAAFEWLAAEDLGEAVWGFRWGEGCRSDLFTHHDWAESYVYADGRMQLAPITDHPAEANLTPTFIARTGINRVTQSGEENPALIEDSLLTFPPNARRAIFQTDLSALISIEPDGTFRRLVADTDLYKVSLQGFVWGEDGAFAANYFGAIGDPVRFITGNVDGRRFSADVLNTPESVTVVGVSEDGARAIIGTTVDGVAGYALVNVATGAVDLLYAAELPGNNWPAPVTYRDADLDRLIYVVRPVDGTAMLECHNTGTGATQSLTSLPLRLADGARAQAALSPDRARLAIWADGVTGGLWIVDLNALATCE